MMLSKSSYCFIVSFLIIAGVLVYTSNFFSSLSHYYYEQNRILSNLADERARKITIALKEEKRQHDEIILRMQSELDKNKEEYERKIKDLQEKKKKEVSFFVDSHGDDPKSMADALSSATGFKVYNGK